MNKNFSNWLVASDIDGTLNNKLRKTPKRNIDAIDKFVNEFSGNFTLASARGVESLKPHYMKLKFVKTPAIVLNGAGIYDYLQEKMIWFNPISKQGIDVAIDVLDKFKSAEAAVITGEMIYLVRPRFFAPAMMKLDGLTHEKHDTFDSVPIEKCGKIIIFSAPHIKKKINAYLNNKLCDEVSFMHTTKMSFDIVNTTTNKGNAVLELAKILGVKQEHTSAIGDYYNDIEMLETVGLPACCGQAPKKLKDLAKFHACHCNKGAVADLLEHIENNY